MVARKVHISRDIMFDEAAQWDRSEETNEDNAGSRNFAVEYKVMSSRSAPEMVEAKEQEDPTSPLGWAVEGDEELVSPHQEMQGMEDHLESYHDDAPLRLGSMESIIGEATLPSQTVRNLEKGQLFAVSAEEPTSLEDVSRQPCWHAAMVEELKTIEDNNT
jgi:hypothetical protein